MPGFGVAAGLSRTERNSVQYAQKESELGEITDVETFGGIQEVDEEDYAGATFTNEAVNGQSGTPSAGVVTEHTLTEVNNDFAKTTKKTVKPLPAAV